MASNHNRSLYKDYEKLLNKFEKVENTVKVLNDTISSLNDTINTLNNTISKKDELNKKLLLEIERLKNNNNKDSSNSGKPSSTDGFKKVSNSRPTTKKKQGGQKGHKGTTSDVSKVEALKERDDVIVTVVEVGKTRKNRDKEYKTRYVQDIKITNVLTEIRYYPDEKGNCNIPKVRHNLLTYGENLKSISMLMVHRLPASMDGVKSFLSDITNKTIDITKATLVNWSKQVDKKLTDFVDIEIYNGLLNSNIVHTDESPININNEKYQLHNYSNDEYTLQYMHKSKSKAAMIELGFLSKYAGILVHDHNKVQYNFGAENAECNVHILRYLKGVSDFSNHKWASDMSNFLKGISKARNKLLEKGVKSFSDEKIKMYEDRYDEILREAIKQRSDKNNAYYREEKALITRLGEYKENHLLFIHNFKVPFTNNRAEADIRPVKRKLNIGIFRSENGAKYYLRIRSFISTFMKNGLNIFEGIKDIFAGKKITLQGV